MITGFVLEWRPSLRRDGYASIGTRSDTPMVQRPNPLRSAAFIGAMLLAPLSATAQPSGPFVPTKAAMADEPSPSIPEPASVWAAQAVWFDRIAVRVTTQLVARWKDRLGGIDSFTHGTVVAAVVSFSTTHRDCRSRPPVSTCTHTRDNMSSR